jgi:hypothetical protein
MCFHSYCATLHGVAARELGQLSSETKGVLLALVVLDAGEAACAGLAAMEREGIFQAWRALGRLPEKERAVLLAGWRAEAARILPAGFEALHPSWIEDALATEPPYLIESLRGGLPGIFHPVLDNLLARTAPTECGPASAVSVSDLTYLAFGHLVPLCEGEVGALAARLCAMPFGALLDEVTRMGARILGHSLVGSDAAVRSRAMAMAGPPWGELIGRALGEAISDEQRRAAAAHVAGAVDSAACTPAERLLHIGLRGLEVALSEEPPGSLARVAGRLPAGLGRRLLGW